MSFSSGPQQRHRKGEEDEGENEHGGRGWEETRSRILPPTYVDVCIRLSF